LQPSAHDIAAVCTIGIGAPRGGRSSNQDNYLICLNGEVRWREGEAEHIERSPGAGALVAVADGMGGHDHGELASAAAVQALARLYRRGRPALPETTLRTWALQAHRRLRSKALEEGIANMGTTLTVAWVLGDAAYWVQIGDSRLYHQRGEELRRLTRDHTRGEFAARDRRRVPKDPQYLAQNFIFGSRGLGDDEGIRIDPGVDSGQVRLKAGDRLLLCSDGLCALVPDHRIRDALREDMGTASCAAWLVDRALAAGSDDNITALVLSAGPPDELDPTVEGYALWDRDNDDPGDDFGTGRAVGGDALVPDDD
jgi:PPM family protein phosphatase